MGRARIKRKSTYIDMTAMSDVTVLLLTFFMLTSTFIKKEPVNVITPASISEIKIPETDVLQIWVEPTGKIFMSLEFIVASTFGVPMQRMSNFLNLTLEEQDKILKTQGIPCDSTDNQFKSWVRHARSVNPDLRIAIKADADTPYAIIKNVMNSLQDLRENRYNLITSLKSVSEG